VNVIQPLDLETSYRTFQFKGDHYLCITSKLYFPLLGGHPLVFSEAYDALSSLPVPFIDEGLPKVTPEVLVLGEAQSPNQQPVSSMEVSLALGDLKKTLLVVGDRFWTGGLTGASKPEPFTTMPLTWDRAFGGKEHKENPLGLGLDKQASPFGEDLIKLPNLEHPSHLMTSLTHNGQPAGFSPLGADHPERSKHMGTYDERWLQNEFPGYPRDFNFDAFNCAPLDQRIQDKNWVTQPITMTGAHHQHAVIESKLPQFDVETHLVKKGVAWENLTEQDLMPITNTVDTVVLFPNQLMGLLIYRATMKVDTIDGSEYQYLLSTYKDKETARDKKDHLNSLIGRLHPELSVRYAMTTKDLIPSSVPCAMARLMDQDSQPENLLAQHIEEKALLLKNEKLAEAEQSLLDMIEQQSQQGLDTTLLKKQLHDLNNPVKDEWQLKFEAISERLAPLDKETGKLDLMKLDFTAFDDLSKLSQEYADFQMAQTKQHLAEQISNAIDSGNQDAITALQTALDRLDAPAVLPRPADPMATLNQIQASLPNSEALALEDLQRKLEAAYEAQIEGYRMGAHMLDMGTPPLQSQASNRLDWALARIEAKEPLKFADLAGLDFSNMDLRGVDFSYCYLEQCNFRHADLSHANLSHAIAPRCDFTYAKLENTDLTKANLGAGEFRHAVIVNTPSQELEVAKSDFSYAKLSGLDLSETVNLLDLTFHQTVFTSVKFNGATFLEVNFSESIISDCSFEQATFNECHLPSIQVRNSNMMAVNFIDCSLTGSQWLKSDLTNARFLGDKAVLNNAQFYECILANATVRKISASYVEFLACTMNGADFSESDLSCCQMQGCTVKDGLFISAELENSQLSNNNLMASNFMQARLAEANMSQSNFYGAEFLGAYVHHTDFSGANMDASKLADWRPNKWQ